MGQFVQNGVIYEELPDGNVRVVGHQAGNSAPEAPYKAPKAAAEVQGAQIENQLDEATLPYDIRTAKATAIKAEADAQQAQESVQEENADRLKRKSSRDDAMFEIAKVLYNIDEVARDATDGGGWFETGYTGSKLRNTKGTAAYDLSRKIDNIDANSAFNALRKMREESKTGAAVGNVTEQELELLAATVASIDPDLSGKEFKEQLERARLSFARTLRKMDSEGSYSKLSDPGYVSKDGRYSGDIKPDFSLLTPDDISTPALIQARQQLADPGKDFKSVDDPKLAGVNQRIAEMMRAGIPDDQIRGYAKSAGVDIANTTLEKALDFRRANPKYTGGYSVNVDDIQVPVSGIDQARNSIAQSAPGTAFATAANAVSFGVPEALAPDQYKAIRDENPGSAFLGDVAGVIGGTGAVGAIGRAAAKRTAPNLLGGAGRAQFGRNVAADATYGGIYGGVSEGDPVTGALSAAGGSVLGAGIGKVAARPVSAAFNSGPVSNSVNRARSIIGKRSVPQVPKLSSEDAAILSAIGGDKAAIAEKLTQAGDLDIPMTLADSSEGLTSLAGAAVRRSPVARNTARNVFEPRQAGQVDRLLGGVERDIGPISNIPQLSDDLIAKARAESRPLYESALSRPGASSVDLSRFADRPAFKQAMRKAYETARNRGETGDTLGIDLNQAGEPFLTRTPDFRTLDNIKKGLDDVVEGYKDPTTGRYNFDGNGYAVNETLRDFIGEVDRINPDYAAARKAYAGPATQRSSLAAGGDAYTQTPDELARSFENSPAQEQFKLGYTGAIAKDVNNVNYSGNPYQRVLGSPAKQQKLASLFPEGAPNMVQRFNLEMDMARANNAILGGSPTALNQNADAAFSNPFLNAATDIGTDLALGAPLKSPSLINRAIGPIKDARKIGFGKQKAQRIAPILFDDNAAKYLKELSGKARKRSMLGKKANQKAYDAARAAAFGATYPLIIDAQR